MALLKIGPLELGWERGEPFTVGDTRVIPLARVWRLGRRRAVMHAENVSAVGVFAGGAGPLALVVERPGSRRLIPIIDVTRWGMGILAGLGLASILAARAATRALKRRP